MFFPTPHYHYFPRFPTSSHSFLPAGSHTLWTLLWASGCASDFYRFLAPASHHLFSLQLSRHACIVVVMLVIPCEPTIPEARSLARDLSSLKVKEQETLLRLPTSILGRTRKRWSQNFRFLHSGMALVKGSGMACGSDPHRQSRVNGLMGSQFGCACPSNLFQYHLHTYHIM